MMGKNGQLTNKKSINIVPGINKDKQKKIQSQNSNTSNRK